MKIQKILAPVDYSACSKVALNYAAALAEKFGASLDLVHVWDRPLYVPETVTVRQPSGDQRSLVELIRENAEQEMNQFLSEISFPPGVKQERRLLSGEPASALLEAVASGRHDLIVVGTHGRTGLKHALLGSVAEKLVRLAPIPVLTVRQRDTD